MESHLRELKALIVTLMLCIITFSVVAAETTETDSLDFKGTSVTVSGLPDNSSNDGSSYSPNGEYVFYGIVLGKPAYERVVDDIVLQLKWVSYDLSNNSPGDPACWVFKVSTSQLGAFAFCPEFTDSVPLNGWVASVDDETDGELELTMTGCFEDNIILDPLSGVAISVTGTDTYDGDFMYTGMENDYPTFTNTISLDSVVTIRYYYGWRLELNGQELYTNNYFENSVTLVPENNWIDINAPEGTRGDIMYVSEYEYVTVDIFEDKEVVVVGAKYDDTYTYDGMINDYPSYSAVGPSMKHVILKTDTAWLLKRGSESTNFATSGLITSYTNNEDESYVPQNGWVDYKGSTPVMNGSATTFVYEGETLVATGSENGDADGVYTFVEFDDNSEKVIFSMTATSGAFSGSVLTVQYETWPERQWVVKATVNDVDTILYTNSNLAYNSVMECIPQDSWMPTTADLSVISLTGVVTAAYNDAQISITGDDELEGVFVYAGMVNDKISFVNGYYELSFNDDVWNISKFSVPYYTNENTSGVLVPENKWTSTGESGEDIVISGDSTFFVEELSAIADNMIADLTVYPNPASNFITIESNLASSLQVYTLTGVCVMSRVLEKGANSFSISELDNGVYLFVTTENGNTNVKRVIKK